MQSDKIKILVCCHKKAELPKDDVFLPIQVGSSLSQEDLGMQRDDRINGLECDNISNKNRTYCELTAIYWAWKNIKKLYPDLEYVGLNHYRRFFNLDENLFSQETYPESMAAGYKIDHRELDRIIRSGKSVFAPRFRLKQNLAEEYCIQHHSKDYRNLKKLFREKYPDYYQAFIDVNENNNHISFCNMFIMPFDVFNDYCTWLFAVLDDYEAVTDMTGYDDYQKRLYGFIAERLLNVYIYKNHSIFKNCSFKAINVYTGDEPYKKQSKLKYRLNDARIDFSFKLRLLSKHKVKY